MRKNMGVCAGIFPMPVLLISTYNEDGTVDMMNAAWGMMLDMDKVMLNLTETHKTVKNIKERKAFTISLTDINHIVEADYVGLVSGNNTIDKFEKTGFTSIKSDYVDAPIINELPLCMECEFIEYQSDETGGGVVGKIVNISVDEKILNDDGKIDASLINTICYDPFNHNYYEIGKKVGKAFSDGKKLK